MSREPGCQRRRRKAIERRNLQADLLWRRENPLAAAFADLTVKAEPVTRTMRHLSVVLDGGAQ